MKKTFLAVLLLFIPFLSYSQTSSGVWNSTTATYTNSVHKITWKLVEDLNWIERPFLTDGILFKMRNDDTHVLVKIGATETEPIDQDIWDEVSMFESDEFTKPTKQLAAYNGMEFIGTKAVKSQICGIHAVKTRTDMKKYYPEYNQTVHSIEITYTLYRNGYIYTVSVTALSVLEEEISEFERFATMLFNGFEIVK